MRLGSNSPKRITQLPGQELATSSCAGCPPARQGADSHGSISFPSTALTRCFCSEGKTISELPTSFFPYRQGLPVTLCRAGQAAAEQQESFTLICLNNFPPACNGSGGKGDWAEASSSHWQARGRTRALELHGDMPLPFTPRKKQLLPVTAAALPALWPPAGLGDTLSRVATPHLRSPPAFALAGR